MNEFAAKIQKLGLELPRPPQPVGAYVALLKKDNMAFLSGQLSKKADGKIIAGKVGRDLTSEQAYEAAQVAALNAISLLQSELGLDKVERILRVVGYVQCVDTFYDISQVMNGASDLFVQLWGDQGRHVRSAVGMISLPLNAAVEIELTVQIYV